MTLLTALRRQYYVIHLGGQQPVQMDGCDTLSQFITLCCHSSSCRVAILYFVESFVDSPGATTMPR